MELNAKQMESVQPVLEYGFIATISKNVFQVVTERGVFDSHLSFSCLVVPVIGDRVLLSVDEIGSCYILSIIERPVTGNTQLNLAGDVALNVHGGRLFMTSDETISLATPHLEINASEGLIRMDKTSFLGRIVENQVEKLKLIADSVHSTIRQAVGRFTSSYRYVEEHEEVQSGSTRMIVDGTFAMHTKNTMAGGMNMGFPDVCLTPTPVGPVPIPYPNTSTGATFNPATTALTVLCDGMPSLNQMSMGTISMGDNAGVNLGVASGLVMGPTEFILGSFTVFKGGTPAQRMTSMTGHNGLSMNCPGVSLAPSQVKVIVLG